MGDDASEPLPAVEGLLVDAEHALGIRITIRDDAGFFVDPLGFPLIGPQRRSHRPIPVCGVGFDQRCIDHCRHAVGRQAETAAGPFVHQCWKGVSELVVPVVAEGKVRALVFAGSWRRSARPPGSATGLPRGWAARYRALRPLESSTIARQGRLLALLVDGLARLRGHADGGSRRASIIRYVAAHHADGASLPGLARALGLSPSRAGHLVTRLFGRPLTALLWAERLTRARALLVTTDLAVSEIARRIGMRDEYHFNRSFRRAMGVPPGRFRRMARSGAMC